MTPTVTIAIMIVDNALISGLTPKRTAEKILIGSVVADGPDVNDAITRSSSDRVKASNQPEITAGAMIGKVTSRNACAGEQPRSSAASSSDWSNVTRREETTTETKHIEKVVCASTMVRMPRSSPIPMNNSNSDRPVITSGMTSGA
ncbi:hypothetical protein RUE5091_04580 [Ruegeria denitrificans]|uniref:Uncharacterized protein n=1 Tax=Ruegeria denitrificans TaxID=1715692 RepID=A0A0P1IL31_9RHOB|nr:hypothetical protein RUE5091_04580 [Ruegeria denitrificans]